MRDPRCLCSLLLQLEWGVVGGKWHYLHLLLEGLCPPSCTSALMLVIAVLRAAALDTGQGVSVQMEREQTRVKEMK